MMDLDIERAASRPIPYEGRLVGLEGEIVVPKTAIMRIIPEYRDVAQPSISPSTGD